MQEIVFKIIWFKFPWIIIQIIENLLLLLSLFLLLCYRWWKNCKWKYIISYFMFYNIYIYIERERERKKSPFLSIISCYNNEKRTNFRSNWLLFTNKINEINISLEKIKIWGCNLDGLNRLEADHIKFDYQYFQLVLKSV